MQICSLPLIAVSCVITLCIVLRTVLSVALECYFANVWTIPIVSPSFAFGVADLTNDGVQDGMLIVQA
jgi:hypothetical protein